MRNMDKTQKISGFRMVMGNRFCHSLSFGTVSRSMVLWQFPGYDEEAAPGVTRLG